MRTAGSGPSRTDGLASPSRTMKVDKKSRGDLLRFIVLDGLGKPAVLEGPDPAVLFAAYGEVAV